MHFSDKSEIIDYCIACNDPVEGLKLLSNGSFDILFLDYNMPLLNGQELLDLKKDTSKVIMITSNSLFAVDSYKYDDVIDYMVKPLDYHRFHKAVTRFYGKIDDKVMGGDIQVQKSIIVKDGNDWIPVSLNSILYVKSESNYCTFYTKGGTIMTLAKLKDLQEKLPANFMRCHRSYIINTDFIARVNLEEIVVQDKTIPISNTYKEDIKRFLRST